MSIQPEDKVAIFSGSDVPSPVVVRAMISAMLGDYVLAVPSAHEAQRQREQPAAPALNLTAQQLAIREWNAKVDERKKKK